jgi:hypothetical protein
MTLVGKVRIEGLTDRPQQDIPPEILGLVLTGKVSSDKQFEEFAQALQNGEDASISFDMGPEYPDKDKDLLLQISGNIACIRKVKGSPYHSAMLIQRDRLVPMFKLLAETMRTEGQ